MTTVTSRTRASWAWRRCEGPRSRRNERVAARKTRKSMTASRPMSITNEGRSESHFVRETNDIFVRSALGEKEITLVREKSGLHGVYLFFIYFPKARALKKTLHLLHVPGKSNIIMPKILSLELFTFGQ